MAEPDDDRDDTDGSLPAPVHHLVSVHDCPPLVATEPMAISGPVGATPIDLRVYLMRDSYLMVATGG